MPPPPDEPPVFAVDPGRLAVFLDGIGDGRDAHLIKNHFGARKGRDRLLDHLCVDCADVVADFATPVRRIGKSLGALPSPQEATRIQQPTTPVPPIEGCGATSRDLSGFRRGGPATGQTSSTQG